MGRALGRDQSLAALLSGLESSALRSRCPEVLEVLAGIQLPSRMPRALFVLFLLCRLASAAALTVAQKAVVDGSTVYNAEMKAAPPVAADRIGGGWPYGVVFVFEGDRFLGSGSITHLGNGLLATASHVVNAPSTVSPPPERTYAVVHYDTAGKRAFFVAESLVVDDRKSDLAVLKAPAETSVQWHSLSEASLFRPVEEKIPTAEAVRLFGSSPLGRNNYLLSGKDASRVVRPGNVLEILVDKKDGVVVPGNSGSIILSKEGTTIEGVFSRGDGVHGEGTFLTAALGLSARADSCGRLISLLGN